MSAFIASIWHLSSDLCSGWLAMVTAISILACYVASLRAIRNSVPGQLLVIIGAPVLFLTVLFSEAGMLVLTDGREFGFPIWARANPQASDIVTTYVALGASYLLARQSTRMPFRFLRVVGWIEVIGFMSLAAFEIFLLLRRTLSD